MSQTETLTIEQRLALLEQRIAHHDAVLVKLRALAMRSPVGRAIVGAIGLK